MTPIEPFDITVDMSSAEIAGVIRRRLFANIRFLIPMALILAWGCWLFATVNMGQASLFAAILAGALCFRFWRAPAIWLRMNPHLSERKTLHISQERLGLTTSTVKSELPWTYFLCWRETSEYFMLDLTATGFCSIVPKAAMTPEQQQAFRTWAAAQLPAFPKRLKR